MSDKLKTQNIYETQNVDLATYLVFEGIKFIECRLMDPNKNIVQMRFLDEKQNCLDLERVFLNSEFKRFRDINKYILKMIHQAIKNGK